MLEAMKFFDVGGQATGFIAIGQQATGFLAIGQMATGFIAIGQLARGVIAVGQLGVGLVGWGQGGVGVMHAIGMLGVGGRGMGIVLPLVPSLGRARIPPQTTSLQVVHGTGRAGWVSASIAADAWGLGLYDGNARLPVKLDRRVIGKGAELCQHGPFPVYASVQRLGQTLVCDRIVYEPARPYKKREWWIIGAIQLCGLLVLGAIYWVAAGNDLIAFTRKAFELDEGPASAAPVWPAPGSTPPVRKPSKR
jgi:hypothetical protein